MNIGSTTVGSYLRERIALTAWRKVKYGLNIQECILARDHGEDQSLFLGVHSGTAHILHILVTKCLYSH